MGKKGLSASRSQKPVHLVHERRLSSNAIANIDAIADAEEESGATLSPISVNRAVSAVTMAKLDDFYVKGMGAKKVSDDSANGVTRKCYLWTGATVDVCFTSRPDSATKGSFKVEDFENMLNTVHKNIIVGHPYCQVDKWEDNNYAIDSFSASTSSIISYINANNVPHVCESGSGGSGMSGLHYIFDPTGWGIQADLSFSSQPNDCSSEEHEDSGDIFRRLQGSYNPACQSGTCAAPGPSPPTPPAPPTPTPPTPPSPPSPPPSPSPPSPPSPGAHCDQCSRLVNAQCGFAKGTPGACQGCAQNHAKAWFPLGCQLPGCEKPVADACAPEAADMIV